MENKTTSETKIEILQKIIKDKAEKRLKKDLLALYQSLTSQRLLENVTLSADRNIEPRGIFNLFFAQIKYGNKEIDIHGTVAKKIFDTYLPIYEEEEAKEFVRRVDEVKEYMDNTSSDKEEDY